MWSTTLLLCIYIALVTTSPIIELEPRKNRYSLFKTATDNSAADLTEDDILVKPQPPNLMFASRIYMESTQLWKDGIIPYEFSPDLLRDNRASRIRQALYQFHLYTCVKFVPRTAAHYDYVYFMDGGPRRCFSYVGRVGGAQEISMGVGCEQQLGVIVHEVMHALGIVHEQSRPDRDGFVDIQWNNIIQSRRRNFEKYPLDAQAKELNVPYDYSSIMHYNAHAFSVDGRMNTILTRDPKAQDVIGQRNGFSACDLEKINIMYDCPISEFALRCSRDAPPDSTSTSSIGTTTTTAPTTTTTKPTTTVATTTLTTPGVLPGWLPDDCLDEYVGCADIGADLSACDKFPGIYRRLCAKTCNKCAGWLDEAPVCMDSTVYASLCRQSVRRPADCANQFLLRAVCPRSCRICQP